MPKPHSKSISLPTSSQALAMVSKASASFMLAIHAPSSLFPPVKSVLFFLRVSPIFLWIMVFAVAASRNVSAPYGSARNSCISGVLPLLCCPPLMQFPSG